MGNAGLDEAQAGIKISGRHINNLRYADDTTIMAESREELKRLLMKVKEYLFLYHQILYLFTPTQLSQCTHFFFQCQNKSNDKGIYTVPQPHIPTYRYLIILYSCIVEYLKYPQ